MKQLKIVVHTLLAFIAVVAIKNSHELQGRFTGELVEVIKFSVLLLVSVFYCQWLAVSVLVPTQELPINVKTDLSEFVANSYANGFFKGTVGLGYFLYVVYVFSLIKVTPDPIEESFLASALFLIGIGTLSKIRQKSVFITNYIRENEQRK